MKKSMKKVLAAVLALVMIMSTAVVSFAAVELNSDAVAKHYGQYENYLLLGDSAASGYRDQITENDEAYNEAHMDSTYFRYTGSYADVLANAIIKDKSMTALAAPGFRTIEMRYMLEDDFAKTCEDEYLFHPSHLYIYEDQVCDCCGENMLPGSEHFRKLFKKSIAEADLISLGIGGNDWGAYLTWVLADVIEQSHPADKYLEEVKDIIDNGTLDMSTVEQLLEIAHIIGVLPDLILTLPEALNYGLTNFYTNWDIMIEDIYALNPDVTLMVVGMSDNGIKGKYYDYPEAGVVGESVPASVPEGEIGEAVNLIVDFIMGVGNGPMIEGARKFGYTYVDVDGATYVDSHPDADGHKFIANKIIEALPDPEIKNMFEDMKPGNKYYSAVEYVVSKGIMTGLTETTFGADEAITSGQLAAAVNAICGTDNSTDSTAKAKMLEVALAMLTGGAQKGFTGFFKGFGIMVRVMAENSFNVGATISRGEAANYLKDLSEI